MAKPKVSREDLVALAKEMNNVMGLEPAIICSKKVSDEDLLAKIIEEGTGNIYQTDFEEDEEDAEKDIFSEEATATLKKLKIEVVQADDAEEVEEEVEEEKPAKKGKGKKEVVEEEEEAPKKSAKGKKEEPAKKGKAKPEPEPEEVEETEEELTAEDINEMKFKELVQLIEDKELDVDADDYKPKQVDELREAIIEELGLNEEEEEEEKPAKKGAKAPAKEEKKPAKGKGKVVEEEEEEAPKKGAKKSPVKTAKQLEIEKKNAAKKERLAEKKGKKKGESSYSRAQSIAETITGAKKPMTFDEIRKVSGELYAEKKGIKFDPDYTNWYMTYAFPIMEAMGTLTVDKNGKHNFLLPE